MENIFYAVISSCVLLPMFNAAPTYTGLPAANRQALPAANQQGLPAVNQQALPAANQQALPAANQRELPVANQQNYVSSQQIPVQNGNSMLYAPSSAIITRQVFTNLSTGIQSEIIRQIYIPGLLGNM